MKNATSIKSNKDSPKTPGGISKSLLTPCRRVGLSRNWKKKGPSPFISPLSSSTQVQEEKTETRKRKSIVENIQNTPDQNSEVSETNDIDKTPSRHVELPRRKKSKILSAIKNSQDDSVDTASVDDTKTKSDNDKISRLYSKNPETVQTEPIIDTPPSLDVQTPEFSEFISTPVRIKSSKSKKRSPLLKTISKKGENVTKPNIQINDKNTHTEESREHIYAIKEKSPNDLRKECVVVIQRKIFKNIVNDEKNLDDKKISEQNETENKNSKKEKDRTTSQALFDSDSDEVPLIQLNNNFKQKSKSKIDNDEDFVEKPTKLNKEVKPNNIKSPKSSKSKTIALKIKGDKTKQDILMKKPSQSSFDDDDDDFEDKRTILIKKSYDKVVKPLKAKSTGSITQKDIDDLRARIESKKKLLLAQSLNPETAELRNLIKRWQKGCQDALMELMDLMKNKLPDKQNMDYSQMLDTLKIPHSLVGYDSENDCFNSPDDANIILGQL